MTHAANKAQFTGPSSPGPLIGMSSKSHALSFWPRYSRHLAMFFFVTSDQVSPSPSWRLTAIALSLDLSNHDRAVS